MRIPFSALKLHSLLALILMTPTLAMAEEPPTSQDTEDQSDETESEKTESDEPTTEETSTDSTDTQETTQSNSETEDSTAEKVVLSPIDTSNAESLDKTLTKEQLKWLQPTRGKLPQNPYQHIDFTAYTLEWGEVQAGLNRSSIGILPRTQVGTQVPLWLLNIQNANAKVNLLRLGPVDVALTGNYLSLNPEAEGGLSIQYYGVGAHSSFRILDNWSIHAGGQYAELAIEGIPSLSNLSGPIKNFTGLSDDDISSIDTAIDESLDYARAEQIISAKIATDIRLNRRDSFILQGNYMKSTTTDSVLSGDFQGATLALNSEDISSPLFRYLLVPEETSINYGASLAYQASFKRAYLRLGVGYSNIPYAWLLQSIDLTWRWGGETKRRANDIEALWKLNKKLNAQGADGLK